MSSEYEYEWTVDRRKKVMCWCFTLNNYTEDELKAFEVLGSSGDVKYLIIGKEVGAEGTPHLQGFIQFRHARTFVTVTMDMLPKRCAKVRPMYSKSSPFACYRYCSKDGDVIEYGDRPLEPGKPGRARQQADYEAAIQLAREDRLDEIDAGLRLRYDRTLRLFRDEAPKAVKDLEGCCGLWIKGPPGTGKSHFARKKFGESLFIKPLTKWWCKYRGQKVVLLEDVDKHQKDWIGYFLKIWADKYAFPAEVKSSQASGADGLIRPDLIVVTSNYSIIELFTAVDETLTQAILDRFKSIEMTKVRPEKRAHVLDGFDLNPYDSDEEGESPTNQAA